MTIVAVAIFACGLLAAALALGAVTRGRRGHPFASFVDGLLALALLGVAAIAALSGVDILSYSRLTQEAPAAEVRFTQDGERRFTAELIYPAGRTESFPLAGDEWEIDARVLKWHSPFTLLGLDTAFRLDRLGGRYRNIDDERNAPRTVHELDRPAGLDVWSAVHRFHRLMPFLDARYGSATYLPMADGAHYAVSVSTTGLLARPLNREARAAVADWH